jgi:hypothetical protein
LQPLPWSQHKTIPPTFALRIIKQYKQMKWTSTFIKDGIPWKWKRLL